MTIWTPDIGARQGPKYIAIADALADDIQAGRLRDGDKLPPHRNLAYALGVTVGTVTRAYKEAERRGLIRGEVGRGSFVGKVPEDDYNRAFGLGATGDIINFAFNLPASGAAKPMLEEVLRAVAAEGLSPDSLGFHPSGGSRRHREIMARWIGGIGIDAPTERVLITAGAMNGILISLMAVCVAGDVVMTEDLTFPGIKIVAERLGLKLQGVATDDEGLDPDALEAACVKTGSRTLYCVPTIQNTTGTVMSGERRRRIADIARRHKLHVIEDDVLGFHHAPLLPPIATFYPEGTFYLNSSSKILAEGFRVGVIVPPVEWVGRVVQGIHATVYFTSAFTTDFVCRCIEQGVMDKMIHWHRAEIKRRHDTVGPRLHAAGIKHRLSGYIAWVDLPAPWRAADLIEPARARGLQLIGPGSFAVGRSYDPHKMRLAFGKPASTAEIERGLDIFIELVKGSQCLDDYLV